MAPPLVLLHTYKKKTIVYLNGVEVIVSLNGDLPRRAAGQQPPILALSFTVVSVPDVAELHHLGTKLNELKDIKVGGVGVQVINDLSIRWERRVIPIRPREIREFIVTTRCLKFCRPKRGMFPYTSYRVGGLEHHRLVLG